MSIRRQARAAATFGGVADDGTPPLELFDPEHPVWSDDALYAAFCDRMGWGLEELPARERFGLTAHPHNRRNYASAAWGLRAGVCDTPGHADWNRLREMGLIG